MRIQSAPAMALKRQASPPQASQGIISGLASAYGTRDRQGDVILPGAFADSVAAFNNGTLVVPLLMNHGSTQIGSVTSLEETPTGLMITAQLAIALPDVQEIFELAKIGPVPLSVGFNYGPGDLTEDSAGRTFRRADLVEVSVVAIGANAAAATTGTKGMRAVEELLTTELGYSARQAKTFIAKGREALKQPDDSDSLLSVLSAAADRFKTFSETSK